LDGKRPVFERMTIAAGDPRIDSVKRRLGK